MSMSDADALMQQATAAYKAGRKEEARSLLTEIVDQYEHHEQAWLLMSAVVDKLEEQQICLENVLAINPGNEKARKGLETVNQKLAARGGGAGQPAAFSAPSTPSGPVSESPPSAPIGAEFATMSGDSLMDQQAAGDPFESWSSLGAEQSPPADPAPDPLASASSVDWVRDDKPAMYGSGKKVDLPSAREYDDWVQSLNLDGDDELAGAAADSAQEADSASPFLAGNAAPFGDTSFMTDDADSALFAAEDQPESGRFDAFGGNIFENEPEPWGSDAGPFSGQPALGGSEPGLPSDEPSVFDSQGAPFGTAVFETGDEFSGDAIFQGEPLVEDSGRSEVFSSGEEAPAASTPASDDLRFSFNEFGETDDDVEDNWPEEAEQAPGAPMAFAAQDAGAAKAEEYFAYIPASIQAKGGGIDRQSLLMLAGVVLLALLNLASFGYLITSLLG